MLTLVMLVKAVLGLSKSRTDVGFESTSTSDLLIRRFPMRGLKDVSVEFFILYYQSFFNRFASAMRHPVCFFIKSSAKFSGHVGVRRSCPASNNSLLVVAGSQLTIPVGSAVAFEEYDSSEIYVVETAVVVVSVGAVVIDEVVVFVVDIAAD